MSLQDSATKVLHVLAKFREQSPASSEVDGPTLSKIAGLPASEVNDAVALLESSGYVEWRRWLGTGEYTFGQVWITPVGRYESERASRILADPVPLAAGPQVQGGNGKKAVLIPPTPIGSPYGFQDADWERIASMRSQSEQLSVVIGYQFKSPHYDSVLLVENIERMFGDAVETYNRQPGSLETKLAFRPLAAGYGEHLFNEIARDIIASDIAVFDTSDLNPNVMLELGVALTWGVRVLPIKAQSQPKPPSDISGQTWADYESSASRFTDPDHTSKVVRMVERAMRKKGPM
jgi:hypothetical protein